MIKVSNLRIGCLYVWKPTWRPIAYTTVSKSTKPLFNLNCEDVFMFLGFRTIQQVYYLHVLNKDKTGYIPIAIGDGYLDIKEANEQSE